MNHVAGSSAAHTSHAKPSPEVQAKLDLLAIDEPLPAPPARDIIRLLVQSPYRLYLYWNFKINPFQIAQRLYADASDWRIAVRLIDVANNQAVEFAAVAGFTRDFWFNGVAANRVYKAEVGLAHHTRPFVRLLISDVVQTPRAAVSPNIAPEKDFGSDPAQFIGFLNRSGFTEDAFAVARQAVLDYLQQPAPTQHANAATDEAVSVTSEPISENTIQTLIKLLASGKTFDELRQRFSPQLLALFQALPAEVIAVLDSLIAADSADENFVIKRIFTWRNVGGSLVSQPQDFNRRTFAPRWFPSMNR